MSTDNSNIISNVLKLAKGNKYEITNAMFHLMDHMQCIDLSSSMRSKKLSSQAVYLLAEGHMEYDYDLRVLSTEVDREEENNTEQSSLVQDEEDNL